MRNIRNLQGLEIEHQIFFLSVSKFKIRTYIYLLRYLAENIMSYIS